MFNTETVATHVTTDAGVNFDIAKVNTRSATVVVRNTGAKSAKFQLLGAVRENYVAIGTEETLASGAVKIISVTDYWPHLRVVGKPNAAGEQTTLFVESASTDS